MYVAAQGCGKLYLNAFDHGSPALLISGTPGMYEREDLKILVSCIEDSCVRADPTIGHRALQSTLIAPGEFGVERRLLGRGFAWIETAALETPRCGEIGEVSRAAWTWMLALGVHASKLAVSTNA